MTDVLTLAECSGFYGDRSSALSEVLDDGPVDVVTGDYLAELTLLILHRARVKDPSPGYAATFLRQLEPVLATIAGRGVLHPLGPAGQGPGRVPPVAPGGHPRQPAAVLVNR